MFRKLHKISSFTLGNASCSQVLDTAGLSELAVQLNYSTGNSTTAKLQASNDKTNWADYPSSTVTLDNAGGTQIWNLVDYQPIWLKVVVTGDALSCSLKVSQDIRMQ